ncbi:IS110 family transposase [Caldithrix abyssi]|nr:IS110 family transposase [Caldithrix abyssi]
MRDTYTQILNITENKRKKLAAELIAIAKTGHSNIYELLVNIPRTGPIGAAVIIAFFGRFESFENSKQVISFIGENPSIVSSGKFKGKARISRKGIGYCGCYE